jgi:hypothetical protein
MFTRIIVADARWLAGWLAGTGIPPGPIAWATTSLWTAGTETWLARLPRSAAMKVDRDVKLGETSAVTGKNHSTLGENVPVGLGRKMLGRVDVGHGAKIGGRTFAVHNSPPNATNIGNPGTPIRGKGRESESFGADSIYQPDLVGKVVNEMLGCIAVTKALHGGDQSDDVAELRVAAACQRYGRRNVRVGSSSAWG